MEKLINKCICFFYENFPNHHILDKLDSHELKNVNINNLNVKNKNMYQ